MSRLTIALSHSVASWLIVLLVLAGPTFGAESQDVAAQQARKSPEWLTCGVIYQIWLRSFTPEGTLKAAAKRLPDIADLGATIVYLSPVQLQDDDPRREFWSPRQQRSPTNNPRNPYRVKDYDQIDPEYGTEVDLKQFVATAHELGLRVLMDQIYHHTGPTCVLLEQPGFYVRDDSGKPAINHWNFLRLNLQNPELREYFFANMLHWVKEFDVDGFRCDVSDVVPLDFWEEARMRLDSVRPDLVILSEGVREADQVKAFDVNYSFRWYSTLVAVVTRGESATALQRHWVKRHSTFPRGARFVRYTDNHDVFRSIVLFSERGALAASVLSFNIDGVPFLYNGQEIGDRVPQDLYAHWPINWEAGGLPKAEVRRAFYKRLCQLRRNEPALTDGEVVWLENDQPDSIISFLRRTDREQIVSVVNLANRPVKVQVTMPEKTAAPYHKLLAEGRATSTSDGLTLDLAGFGFFVGKRG